MPIFFPKVGKRFFALVAVIAGLGIFFVWLRFFNPAVPPDLLPTETPPGEAVPQATAPSGRVSLNGYWQKVIDTQAWLGSNPAPETWKAQAEQWSAVQAVVLPDGSFVPVNTSEIVQLLRVTPPDKDRLSDHLSALLRARERWTKTGEATAGLSALERILARPEFQSETDNFLQRLYRRVLEFFLDLLAKLFPASNLVSLPLPPELTIAFAVLLLAGILAFIFRDVWRNILVPETELLDDNNAERDILSANQAALRARQLSGSGDYRQAIRYLYLSALLLLDERGLLRYNRSLTNHEYLRQVSDRPDLANHLRPVIETFDRVWYGFQPVDQDRYAQYLEQVAALKERRE